jgi:PmbA protein
MPAANDLMERALAAARRAGAVGAEVLVTEQSNATWMTQIHSRVRSVPDINTSHHDTASLALRVYLDGGRAAEHTIGSDRLSALAPQLDAAALAAVAAAGEAAPDPLAGPPDRMDIHTRGLSICDPRQARLADEDRRDILSWNWGTARSVSGRIRPRQFTLEERRQRRSFASSRGVLASEEDTRYRISGEVATSARGDERTSAGEVVSRHFADIASRPLGAELGGRLEAGDRTTKMPGEALPLVIEPYIVADILALLPPAFDARQIEAGKSCLQSHFGTRVAPSGLHLVDDASVAGGLATRAFDARGVPSIPVPLMRDGVLNGVYLDPEQARRRDSVPTGHAGPAGSLWAGNILLRPGTRTRNMLFADLSRYLVAIDLMKPPTLDVAGGMLQLDLWMLLDGPERSPGKLGAYRVDVPLKDFLASVTLIASDQSRFGSVVACTLITEGLPLSAL